MRLPTRHWQGQRPFIPHRIILTPDHIRDRHPSRIRRMELEVPIAHALTAAAQYTDQMTSLGALTENDGAVIGVDDVGLRGEVVAVDRDGVVADGVEKGDELVVRGVGSEGGEPEGFAVGGDTVAGEALFLALIDHGDAVCEDGPCENGLGELEKGKKISFDFSGQV